MLPVLVIELPLPVAYMPTAVPLVELTLIVPLLISLAPPEPYMP